MKVRITAIAVGATLLGAVSAQAQITNVLATFGAGYVVAPGVSSDGYYVGPYSGTLQLPGHSATPVVFNCVDFFHDISAGQGWTATLTNLGTGAGIGTTDANSTTRLYGNATVDGTLVSALDVYRTAAYLTTLYPAIPSQNAATQAATIGIQSEIWQATTLFYPQAAPALSYYNPSYDPTAPANGTTNSQSTNHYFFNASLSANQLKSDILADKHRAGMDYYDWWVVTVQTQAMKDMKESPQELLIHLHTTPEPGTLVLLTTGLLGVVGTGVARRRRKS